MVGNLAQLKMGAAFVQMETSVAALASLASRRALPSLLMSLKAQPPVALITPAVGLATNVRHLLIRTVESSFVDSTLRPPVTQLRPFSLATRIVY